METSVNAPVAAQKSDASGGFTMPDRPVNGYFVRLWYLEGDYVVRQDMTYYAHSKASEVIPDADDKRYAPFIDQWWVVSDMGKGRMTGWSAVHRLVFDRAGHHVRHYTNERDANIALLDRLEHRLDRLIDDVKSVSAKVADLRGKVRRV